MNADLTVAILGFVAFSIPIVGALWKVFSVRETLEAKILSNGHRLDLIEQKIEYLIDQQTLALNGQKELIQHVRTRSAHAEEKLDERVQDLERFIEKTTTFTARRQ